MALSDFKHLFSVLEYWLCHLQNSLELAMLVFKFMEINEFQGTLALLLV